MSSIVRLAGGGSRVEMDYRGGWKGVKRKLLAPELGWASI